MRKRAFPGPVGMRRVWMRPTPGGAAEAESLGLAVVVVEAESLGLAAEAAESLGLAAEVAERRR